MLVNLRGIPIIPTKKVASPYVSLPLIHGISRVVTLILPSSPDASRKHNFYLPPKAAHLKARSWLAAGGGLEKERIYRSHELFRKSNKFPAKSNRIAEESLFICQATEHASKQICPQLIN